MNHRTATVKVGLLTVISLLVLITTVIWLRGRSLGGGQPYEIYFRDVDGLRDSATVQFMGIRVGFVDEVTPVKVASKQYRVRVRFTVTEPEVKIPKGAIISLQQSGIIGEKFMEITPPRTKIEELTLPMQEPAIRPQMPIRVAFKDDLVQVGQVLDYSITKVAKLVRKSPDYRYKLVYIVNKPGYLPSGEPEFHVVKPADGESYLLLLDGQALLQNKPRKTAYFTIEEPLRLKEFLEEQLASAESLKMTNEKINQLLSDETIASIQGTLRNSEKLTAQATQVLAQANTLFTQTSKDLNTLVASTQELSTSVVRVSNNINDITGNPELKANIQKTVQSVEQSTAALSTLLNDPNMKLIMSDMRVTSQNASELMQYLRNTAVNNDLQGRMNESLTLLNTSLTRLSSVMEQVETATSDKDSIREIIQDTRETSENLNKFSQRLNKRFLLFRLLF